MAGGLVLSRGADLSQGWGDLGIYGFPAGAWVVREAAGSWGGQGLLFPFHRKTGSWVAGCPSGRQSFHSSGFVIPLLCIRKHLVCREIPAFQITSLFRPSRASKHLEGKAFVPILQMQLVRLGQEQRA